MPPPCWPWRAGQSRVPISTRRRPREILPGIALEMTKTTTRKQERPKQLSARRKWTMPTESLSLTRFVVEMPLEIGKDPNHMLLFGRRVRSSSSFYFSLLVTCLRFFYSSLRYISFTLSLSLFVSQAIIRECFFCRQKDHYMEN